MTELGARARRTRGSAGNAPLEPGSPFARLIARLAPGEDPAHVEAWMRLEHGVLEDVNPLHFAREVKKAVGRVQAADDVQCDTLARRFGLEPRRGRTTRRRRPGSPASR